MVDNNAAITNRLNRIEGSLKRKLLKFYNQKIKGSFIPVDILRQQYERQIQGLIRATVEESYLVGTKAVGETVQNQAANGDEFELFISGTDLNNIATLTQRLSNDFWNKARRLKEREAAIDPKTGDPKRQFDTAAAMTGLAISVAFLPFNTAIKSKVNQVTATPNAPVRLPTPGSPPSLPPAGGGPLGGAPPGPGPGKVMFLTKRDSKVDPDICWPLDGKIWDVGDPEIVTPIIDTHDWCRCKLVPIIDEDAVIVEIEIPWAIAGPLDFE